MITSDEVEVIRFDVAPRAGGGWGAWGVALGRLLARLADGPTQCVIASQDADGRYVQWMIGHRWAYVEVSSNHHLRGLHRLGTTEERQLRNLGFRRHEETSNWSLEIDLRGPREPARLAVLLTHLAEDVALFDQRRRVTIEQFLAAQPCAACTFADRVPADGRTRERTEGRTRAD